MKKHSIYIFGLVMLCTVLYAARITPCQKRLLHSILETLNHTNLSKEQLEESVPAIMNKKKHCGEDFFCLAEKSLNTIRTKEHFTKLINILKEYNNLTRKLTCENHAKGSIYVQELLMNIKECTFAELANRTSVASVNCTRHTRPMGRKPS